MGIEIERKFLVKDDFWRSLAVGKLYRQGYIPTQDGLTTVRVRVVGNQGYLTIKGKAEGISRGEFEYPIPLAEATIMLETFCQKPLIEKVRHRIFLDNLTWEVDEFLGDNQGLIMAEVELEQENQAITIPDWIGEEVTGDNRYYNVNLQKFPYKMW
jgi:CYTH domain-containing protein